MTQPGLFSRRDRGFTLVEIAVVIVILGLLLTMLLGISSSMIAQQRRDSTRARLAAIETALALYASQNQRLPCPADGTLASSNAAAGLEVTSGAPPSIACHLGGGTNSQTNGVVPWRTLGLAESDITDGWNNRLTYRVSPEFVRTASMNLANCDPAGGVAANPGLSANGYCGTATCTTATLASCVRPSAAVADAGLRVQNVAQTVDLMSPSGGTGAAYVVISHGENGAGAYNSQGVVQAAAGGTVGTAETARNGADVAFVKAPDFVASVQVFVDDFPSYVAGTTYFDDFVIRPTLLTVATKAQLGPRAHP